MEQKWVKFDFIISKILPSTFLNKIQNDVKESFDFDVFNIKENIEEMVSDIKYRSPLEIELTKNKMTNLLEMFQKFAKREKIEITEITNYLKDRIAYAQTIMENNEKVGLDIKGLKAKQVLDFFYENKLNARIQQIF